MTSYEQWVTDEAIAVPARLGRGRGAPINPEYHKRYNQVKHEERKAYTRARYSRLKATGLCTHCAKNPTNGKSLCTGCSERHTWKERKRLRGVDKALFLQTWEAQNGCCAICNKILKEYKYGHADHDHKTGNFRGILCSGCNHGLGNFRDSPDSCERAAAYLRLHSGPR